VVTGRRVSALKILLAAISSAYLLHGGIAHACELGRNECQLDPTRVRWMALDLEAKKFFLTGTTAAQVELVASDTVPLISVDAGVPVIPGARALELRATSHGLGINSDTVLWIDPHNGAALQYEVDDTGRRQRRRIYRYTNEGAFHRTRRPAEGEEDSPPEQWTDIESGLRLYAPEAVDQIVVDPVSILYVISAAPLARPGDTLEMYAFARRQTTRLTLTVAELNGVDRNIAKVLARADVSGCGQPVESLLIRLGVEQLNAEAESRFSFLGLQSDIEIWLDPISRMPLRISGKVKIAGRVAINLRAAECNL